MVTAIFIFNVLMMLFLGAETTKFLWTGEIEWPEDVPKGAERPKCAWARYPQGYWRLVAIFVVATAIFAAGAAGSAYSLFSAPQTQSN